MKLVMGACLLVGSLHAMQHKPRIISAEKIARLELKDREQKEIIKKQMEKYRSKFGQAVGAADTVYEVKKFHERMAAIQLAAFKQLGSLYAINSAVSADSTADALEQYVPGASIARQEIFAWTALGFYYQLAVHYDSIKEYLYLYNSPLCTIKFFKGQHPFHSLNEYDVRQKAYQAHKHAYEQALMLWNKKDAQLINEWIAGKLSNEAFAVASQKNSEERKDIEKKFVPLRLIKEDQKEYAQNLVAEYTIYVMPEEKSVTECVHRLLHRVKFDNYAASCIAYFKVCPRKDLLRCASAAKPSIVVYPSTGRENAQCALSIVYELFSDIKANGRKPAHSARVNDLMWITQGNAELNRKMMSGYFEQPLAIYYKKSVTNDGKTYYVRHPTAGYYLGISESAAS